MEQIKNNISWIEIKKLGLYLLRIFVIFGLIQVITVIMGMDLNNYIPDIYQPLIVAVLNWCLEWLNQYKKGITPIKEIEGVEYIERNDIVDKSVDKL